PIYIQKGPIDEDESVLKVSDANRFARALNRRCQHRKLHLGLLAVGNVLAGSFIIQQPSPSISHRPRVDAVPPFSAVLTIDLVLEVSHRALGFEPALQFGTALRAHTHLPAQVRYGVEELLR